jgi:uncharacterized coiled-coil protein SlyX
MNNIHFDEELKNDGEITIETLAGMIARGFQHVDKKFEEMDKRFDQIENLLMSEHRQRIEKLERQMKEVRDTLAI